MDPTIGGVIILGLIVIGFFIFLSFVPLGLWFTALFAGAHVKLFSLIGMRLRRVPPKLIIKQYITSRKAGLGFRQMTWKLTTSPPAATGMPNFMSPRL